MENYDIVKNDFNEIAQLEDPKWNHNNCYYNQIMKLIPDNAETCLEIGCGKGELSFFSSIIDSLFVKGVFLMNKRGAGVSFCFIAAFLFSVRYISAAIFGSGISSWSSELFNNMLNYIGDTPLILSVISLVTGIVYLVLAEKEKN